MLLTIFAEKLREGCLRGCKYYSGKQPLEVLCKTRCFQKFLKIHRKTPVPGSLFKIKLQTEATAQTALGDCF